MSRPLRILHLPAVVGGQAPGLARAERAIGLDSHCVAFHASAYGYVADEVLFDGVGPLVREARRWGLLRHALSWADVVHFNFGASIMPRVPDESAHRSGLFRAYARLLELRDPAWLRRAGKRIVVTFQGDDARQGDRLGPSLETFRREVGPSYYPDDGLVRRRVQAITRPAHAIFALNPDLLRVLPPRAELLPYGHVDEVPSTPTASRGSGKALRIAHAPTHRVAKGTRFLLQAVDRLRAAGVDVELDLIEGVDHAGMMERLADCDVLVDQLLLGWYGGVSVEAMALGKPVVCFIDPVSTAGAGTLVSELPIVSASPNTIETVIAELAGGGRAPLKGLGIRSRAFVQRHHDPRAIAARLERVYRGSA